MAGSGEAMAMDGGTPRSTRTGVANAEPPAPNTPNVTPTPAPAITMSHHVMDPACARRIQRSKT